MKAATLFLSIAIVTLILGSCNSSSNKNEHSHEHSGNNASQTFNLDTTKLKPGDKFYQCEMDLDVISDKPGTCPKCNMALTELKKH